MAELTPIISNASICSVIRIVPISEAMLEPTLPARIRHMMVDENSSRMISRETAPTVNRGNIGESMFNPICNTITAPMKKEIITTIQMEFTPKKKTPFMNSFMNSLILSGIVSTFFNNSAYSPTLSMELIKLMWSTGKVLYCYNMQR
ncbi:hypothetical protein SDC9_154005 [bioreactor metagenome]|uniref:Uncharacterized protein n=1 Tax=bioreactor metagenome TaxID=1076179 RepID=A0A645EZY6_9ZZZZ